MGRFFYWKLAADNIRKNIQVYLPYILTCTATVAMYYLMHSLSQNSGLGKMSGGDTVQMMLSFGFVVVGIFSAVFLLYTNSFLIKRRKKEFGLFNVLGMEKKHLARIMMYETIYIAVISISAGLIGGIVLSKAMFLLLLKLLRFEVQMGFEISGSAIVFALLLFGTIFFLTLLSNLRQVHLAKPIELLKGGQVGEREPKAKWLLTLSGLASMGTGYYLALTAESPIAALTLFFVAVILVMIGTYCLFTAGSIALLKLLRKNKSYYYRPNRFTTVSGLMYRMQRNAVGLANICILSTMVLVTLSTTVALFVGVEDVLKTRYPRDIVISSYGITDEYIDNLGATVAQVVENHNLVMQDPMEYRMLSFVGIAQGNEFLTDEPSLNISPSRLKTLCFIPSEDYSGLTGEEVQLAQDEVLLYSQGADYEYESLSVLGRTFSVRKQLNELPAVTEWDISGRHFLIVKDMDVVEEMYHAQADVYGEHGSKLTYHLQFDFPGDVSEEGEIAFYKDLRSSLPSGGVSRYIESREAVKDEFYSLYGGLFFLGLFLGILFIMGTVLIIYYKQITEGYEDKERFAIMQKVGMSREEVKRSIRSQVLTVFFLPLIVATVHISVAFPFITKLLAVFSLRNTLLFATCTGGTVLIFALFYGLVYHRTARVYYRIVSM
ncbi:MAG: ABC transporter permease [Firmicutes bacterium]|nr:ABC transporter permease [Bacillota bacterium]